MEWFDLTLWEWILPIGIGIIAGLVTNAVAIWMLFHPYEPVYVGPLRILPKGAIPKEIDRIAKRIGETVGNELLTSDDLARTLSSPAFRDRFDEALRSALDALLGQDLSALRDMVPPEQQAELEESLNRVLGKLLEGLHIYLHSPEFEQRVRGVAELLTTDLRDRALADVLTPALHADLVRAARDLWNTVRQSPELERAVTEALERVVGNLLVSEKPLRHYVPSGAVNLGEAVVVRYLPLLLERLGEVLEDPQTRLRLQDVLRNFSNRFLEEQRSWKRLVGRLVITERTLASTVNAIEQGAVDEIGTLLREPDVQARVSAALNRAVEDLLDRPLRDLLGDVSPERARHLQQALGERVVYMLRHPAAEQVVIGRLDALLAGAEGRTVGDVMDVLGPDRAREFADRLAGWIVSVARGPRAAALLQRALERQTSWMVSVPIGRIGAYLPADATRRAEQILFDPLWSFIQSRVPQAVASLPVAGMVENKLKAYPLRKVEELIYRVSGKELGLIVYLGGFLGAMVGGMMLFTVSWPAGLVTTVFFFLVAMVFINAKG